MSDLPELHQRLREAGEEELLALLHGHATELGVPDVRHALRNPYCTAEAIERVAAEQRRASCRPSTGAT
jgi:hypothetical protein